MHCGRYCKEENKEEEEKEEEEEDKGRRKSSRLVGPYEAICNKVQYMI